MKPPGPIYNCHTHIFTHEHVPDYYFLNLPIIRFLRIPIIKLCVPIILKAAIPWNRFDRLNRFAAFIHAAFHGCQSDSFEELIKYYPDDTRFVVLPMDMSRMHAGPVMVDIDTQHTKLAELVTVYPKQIIPFAHIDPRRHDSLSRLKNLVENHGFKGVKIYPALGYDPDHPVLMDQIYPYMIKKNIPLMAHCSPGIVYNRAEMKIEANYHGHPDHYIRVIDKRPELRICLAHFGGIDEWDKYVNHPENRSDTWLGKIRKMLKSGNPNLYTDISYTVFNFQKNVPFLKVFLEDPDIAEKVLFGSDYYMVYNKKYSEKRLSIDLRAALGEEKFWLIAHHNPKRYLSV